MAPSTLDRRARIALLLGLACAACAACAGARAPASAVPQLARSQPVLAERYDTAERPQPVLGARAPDAIARAVADAGREAGAALRGDGRLAQLAREFVAACPAAAGGAALAAAARRLGLVDPAPEHVCVHVETHGALADAIGAALGARLRPLSATHFGVFVAADETRASVILSRRALTLVATPRRIAVGAPLRVRGRIDAVFAEPRLVVRGPDGERSWPAGAGPDFDLQVPMPLAGCYTLELRARAAEDAPTLAALTVYAGAQTSRDPCAEPSPPGEADAGALGSVQRRIERRLSELRAGSGLPALAIDARLERVAARAVVIDAGTRAEPPSARDLGSGLLLIASARAGDEGALWHALSADAARRAKLLNPDVTHAGVVVRATPDGLAAAIAIAQLAPAADLELASARVLDAINRNRGARGAKALRPDATLTDVARRSARAFFARPPQAEREIVAQANAELERFGLSYRRVAALAMVVVDPLDAAALEPALDADAGAAGIAVASGIRADTGAREVTVVIALGWDR